MELVRRGSQDFRVDGDVELPVSHISSTLVQTHSELVVACPVRGHNVRECQGFDLVECSGRVQDEVLDGLVELRAGMLTTGDSLQPPNILEHGLVHFQNYVGYPRSREVQTGEGEARHLVDDRVREAVHDVGFFVVVFVVVVQVGGRGRVDCLGVERNVVCLVPVSVLENGELYLGRVLVVVATDFRNLQSQ